jgi:hypothetical protein
MESNCPVVETSDAKCPYNDPKCGSYELHTCPYQEEIGGDEAFRCRCCPDCEGDCVWEV